MTRGNQDCRFLPLLWILYFPLGFIASCELAFRVSWMTLTLLWGSDPERLVGALFLLSAVSFFTLVPIWAIIFLVICVGAFFKLRKNRRLLLIIVTAFTALSILFFVDFLQSLIH